LAPKKTITKRQFIEQAEKFLEFICKECENSDFLQRNGGLVSNLCKKWSLTGNDAFRTNEIQMYLVTYLLKKGLLEKISIEGKRVGITIYPGTRIRPTQEAFSLVQERKRKWLTRQLRNFYELAFAGFMNRIPAKFGFGRRPNKTTLPILITLDEEKRQDETSYSYKKPTQVLLYWDEPGLIHGRARKAHFPTTANDLSETKRRKSLVNGDQMVIYAEQIKDNRN
jgi:hypothetical protein